MAPFTAFIDVLLHFPGHCFRQALAVEMALKMSPQHAQEDSTDEYSINPESETISSLSLACRKQFIVCKASVSGKRSLAALNYS
jgi:hypothetical protein